MGVAIALGNLGFSRVTQEQGAFLGGYSETLGRYREAIESLFDHENLEKSLFRGAAMTAQEVRSLITESIPPKAGVSNRHLERPR